MLTSPYMPALFRLWRLLFQDLEAAFQQLSDTSLPGQQQVLDWLEDNYIGKLTRRGRRPPVFPHEMCNVHDRVVLHLDRTNNHAEAAHRRIQAELQMDHPTLWKFIDGLKKFRRVVTYSMSNWSPDTLLLGSFDDIDCVTKESNGLCKAMQTTASWTICVDSSR